MRNLRDKNLRSQLRLQTALVSQIDKMKNNLVNQQKVVSGEQGSTTVEYAIGAIATAAFAGLLLAVINSGGVKTMLTNIINSALSL